MCLVINVLFAFTFASQNGSPPEKILHYKRSSDLIRIWISASSIKKLSHSKSVQGDRIHCPMLSFLVAQTKSLVPIENFPNGYVTTQIPSSPEFGPWPHVEGLILRITPNPSWQRKYYPAAMTINKRSIYCQPIHSQDNIIPSHIQNPEIHLKCSFAKVIMQPLHILSTLEFVPIGDSISYRFSTLSVFNPNALA